MDLFNWFDYDRICTRVCTFKMAKVAIQEYLTAHFQVGDHYNRELSI